MGFLSWLGGLVAKWGLDKLYKIVTDLVKRLARDARIDKKVDEEYKAEMDIIKKLNQIDFEEKELLEEGKKLSQEKLDLRRELEDRLREVSSKNDSNLYG